MLHGLYWLAANLALRRPAVLAIDDLHWADRPSLRWISHLQRRLDGLPLLVLDTYLNGATENNGDRRIAEDLARLATGGRGDGRPHCRAADRGGSRGGRRARAGPA